MPVKESTNKLTNFETSTLVQHPPCKKDTQPAFPVDVKLRSISKNVIADTFIPANSDALLWLNSAKFLEADPSTSVDFQQLLANKHAAFVQYEEEVFAKYTQVASHFKAKKNMLIAKKGGGGRILASSLYKIINQGMSLSEGDKKGVTVEKNHFLLMKEAGELKVFKFGKHIGSGGFGKVAKVVDLTACKSMSLVAKCAKPFASAIRDVRLESKMLLDLHQEAMKKQTFQRGIQRPPHVVFDFPDDSFSPMDMGNSNSENTIEERKCVGYLAPRYDSDLHRYSFANMNLVELLDCADQLLCGLHFCAEEKRLRLNDIKVENCLIKKVSDEQGRSTYECVLSDFGGARRWKGDDRTRWGTHTKDYCSEKDVEKFRKLVSKLGSSSSKTKSTHSSGKHYKQKLETLFKARDIFALSFVMKKIFSNKDILPKSLQTGIASLIERMSQPDYKSRISIGDALKTFEQITKPYYQRPK